jgi:hypothetical protein
VTAFTRPATLRVKIPDQANIALVAMTSKRARLIVSVTNIQAPAKITANTMPVVRNRCFGIRCRRMGDDSSSAAKPSTMEPATLSCMSLLTFSGMQPTSARLTPTTERQIWAVSGAPRRTYTRWMTRRSRRTLRA